MKYQRAYIFFIILESLLTAAAWASPGRVISKKLAIQIAINYAIDVEQDIESKLDGESLQQSLSKPTLKMGKNSNKLVYFFIIQDRSGDCGMFIAVNAYEGLIESLDTDPEFQCD